MYIFNLVEFIINIPFHLKVKMSEKWETVPTRSSKKPSHKINGTSKSEVKAADVNKSFDAPKGSFSCHIVYLCHTQISPIVLYTRSAVVESPLCRCMEGFVSMNSDLKYGF